MSLKLKLISTISAFMMILGLLVIGVFAVPSATVNLGGTISFNAENVYAKVSGKIEGAETNPTLSPITIDHNVVDGDISSWKDTNLQFKSTGSPITITITIENLATDRPLYAMVNDSYGSLANLTKSIKTGGVVFDGTPIRLEKSTGAGTSTAEFVISMEVTDKNTSLANGLKYGYTVDLSNKMPEKLSFYDYTVDGDNRTVSVRMNSLQFTKGEVEVPETVEYEGETYKVTTIGQGAFVDAESVERDFANETLSSMEDLMANISKYAAKVTKLTLPNSITTIEDMGLAGMIYLEEINIPESLVPEQLGEDILLMTSPKILTIEGEMWAYIFTNESVTMFNGAFDKVHTIYVIQEEGQDVPVGNFISGNYQKVESDREGYTKYHNGKEEGLITYDFDTENLTASVKMVSVDKTFGAVVVPEKVKNPDDQENLYTVTSVADFAFLDFEGLSNDKSSPQTVEEQIEIFKKYAASITSIELPNTIESIGAWAFACNPTLKSLEIPDKVTTLSHSAIQFSTELESISFGKSFNHLEQFDQNCFFALGRSYPHNNSLKYITVHDENETFEDRDGNCLIEKSTKTMVLAGQNSAIPEGVEKIGIYAYAGGYRNTTLHIPASVTSMFGFSFGYHNEIETITVDANNPIFEDRDCDGVILKQDVRFEYESASYGPQYLDFDKDSLLVGCKNTKFIESIEDINTFAFAGVSSIENLIIPDNIVFIDNCAFIGCSGLKYVKLGAGVWLYGNPDLPENTFESCVDLKTVVVDSASVIADWSGDWPFKDVTVLEYATTLYVKADIAGTFDGTVLYYSSVNFTYTSDTTIEGVAYKVYTR